MRSLCVVPYLSMCQNHELKYSREGMDGNFPPNYEYSTKDANYQSLSLAKDD